MVKIVWFGLVGSFCLPVEYVEYDGSRAKIEGVKSVSVYINGEKIIINPRTKD